MRKLLYLLILPLCFLLGCKSTDQGAIDKQIIQQYISAHHLNATAEANGLYYVPIVTGTGTHPTATSLVSVTYKGYLTDGTVFDQNTTPTPFNLGGVIPGWTQGIPLMQRGGKATLLIPSALGYGSQAIPASGGNAGIPANSVLIFDVDLISFQ